MYWGWKQTAAHCSTQLAWPLNADCFANWIANDIGKKKKKRKKNVFMDEEFSFLTDTDISPGEGIPYKRDTSRNVSKTRDIGQEKPMPLTKIHFMTVYFCLFVTGSEPCPKGAIIWETAQFFYRETLGKSGQSLKEQPSVSVRSSKWVVISSQ